MIQHVMRSNVEIITANHKTYNYFITIQVMEPVEVELSDREERCSMRMVEQ